MTSRRICLCKPLIGVTFLLWCMGGVPGAVTHSARPEQRSLESACEALLSNTEAPRGPAEPGQGPLSTGLAYTAEELRDRIRRVPPPSASPPEVKPPLSRPPGIIKGAEGDHITASCADLTLTLVQLLQKVNALKKREHSLSYALSETEKKELDEANQKLTEVRTLLKARCSAPGSE